MRFLGLIFTLLVFQGCTTTEVEKSAIDNLVSTFAGYGNCSNYDEMNDYFTSLVKKADCSKDDPDLFKDLPDGTWSAKGVCCFKALEELNKTSGVFLKVEKSWKCTKPLNYEIVLAECQTLE